MMEHFNFLHKLDCESSGEIHEWMNKKEYGIYEGYGQGEMTYRECIKCRTIEYSYFRSNDSTEDVNIDAIYRNPK